MGWDIITNNSCKVSSEAKTNKFEAASGNKGEITINQSIGLSYGFKNKNMAGVKMLKKDNCIFDGGILFSKQSSDISKPSIKYDKNDIGAYARLRGDWKFIKESEMALSAETRYTPKQGTVCGADFKASMQIRELRNSKNPYSSKAPGGIFFTTFLGGEVGNKKSNGWFGLGAELKHKNIEAEARFATEGAGKLSFGATIKYKIKLTEDKRKEHKQNYRNDPAKNTRLL